MNSLLENLRSRNWIFEEILPGFRASLIKALGASDSNTSTTALAALYYRKQKLSENPGRSTLQIITRDALAREDLSFWENAVRALKGGVQLASSTPEWKNTVQEALNLISKKDPRAGHQIQRHISYFCTLETEDFRSASHPHYLGTLFLKKVFNPTGLAVSIVHELAHQELFLLNLVDRLIHAENDFHLVHAPYQGRLRPPIGRFHSAHALFRMIGLEEQLIPERVTHHRALLQETVSSFSPGETTEFGGKVLHEVY